MPEVAAGRFTIRMKPMFRLFLLCILALALPAFATDSFRMHDNFRNLRYGEVLVVTGGPFQYTAEVFNTVGLNDCPQAVWERLDAKKLARELGARKVLLNGPRYFMMDEIALQNPGAVKDFDGLEARRLAEVKLSLFTILRGRAKPYTENTVSRTSRYVYKKGRPVYELVAPNGATYILQTYSLIVDPKLTEKDLPRLADRLKLPKGWEYRTRIPSEDIVLTTHGTAKVLQDDLENSYQRVEASPAHP